MKLNLDEIYQRVEPWELTLTIDGADRPVRRLTNVELEQLRRLGQMSPDESVAFLGGLFEGNPPDVRQWDTVKASVVISAVVGYYKELVKKKAARAVEAVAEQMRQPSPPPPPSGASRS